MQYSITLLALVASSFVSAVPQAVTSAISPTGSAPPSCTGSYEGNFEITVVKPSPAKRDLSSLEKRAECGGEGTLVLSLQDGILKDSAALTGVVPENRTAYIADNYQFQFDAPPQAGALVTSGFSVCGNGSIALGDTTVFYQCLSGNFYNLYNTDWAPQCSPVALNVIPCGGSSTPSASTSSASVPTPSAPSTTYLPTDTTSSYSQPEPTTAVTVISDGQPQAPSAIPLSQLSDGQPQMPTALVGELTDGQPQVTSAAPVASGSAPPVPVSQIGDGQPQAGNATVAATPTSSILAFTGGASLPTAVANFAAVAAGFAAVVMI